MGLRTSAAAAIAGCAGRAAWPSVRDCELPHITTDSGTRRARCPRHLCPATARTVQGMAPYLGQASCVALGCWSELAREPGYLMATGVIPAAYRGSVG
jgi:hypothetical protein